MAVPLLLSEVPATTPYIQYIATSGQTVFPYPFVITQDSDLVAVYNGVALSTDEGYTLSGQGNLTGGNVTFTTGANAGDVITLYRDVEIERITQIGQNSGFSSTTFNAEFNNIYLILQQLEAANEQALQIPNTNTPAPLTTLTPANYANKFLGFDANGNPIPLLPPTLAVPASGAILIGQTPAEAAVSVVPTTLTYLPGDPRRYGNTVGSGGDDTSAWNQCLAANKITICQGALTYNISATITPQNGATIDFQQSTLNLNDSTGLLDHIKVGTGTAQYNNVTIKNGIFTRTQAATSGYAINFDYVGDCTVVNALVFGNSRIYGGVNVLRGINVNIFDSYMSTCVAYGVNAAGTGTGGNETNGLRIDRCLIQDTPTGANFGNYVEGLYVRNNVFFSCSTAGASYGATNGRISAKFQQNDFDTCGIGLYAQELNNITVNENWFSNNTGTSLVLKSSVGSGTVNGNQFYSSGSLENIEIGGPNFAVAGNIISGGGYGVYVKSTATDVSITGNRIANCGYAVYLAENPTGVSVVGNNLLGNVTGTIADAVSPNARYIANNMGYNPLGANGVSVTSSPMTYTAGSSPETLNFWGGTSMGVTIGGITWMSTATQATFRLAPQQSAVLTYSGSPFLTKYIE